ncbi:caspase-23 [Myxocyprinus asiaticus]|uniref:caspase-23 n=1 Tax=Myxocyprinus asiaticus TaxID=70543 RepID=UPI0022227BEB|nr:caspase-23 [Myxocyprinus asiaticus]
MTEEDDKWYQYSEDAAIVNVFRNLRIQKPPTSDRNLEERAPNGKVDSGVALPCGHQMPTDYVVACFKYYIKKKETEFTCPRFNEGEKKNCGAKLSYQEVCGLIQLTTEQRGFLEANLAAIAARRLFDFKFCPGCLSHVERRDKRNLCVHCTVCTANLKRIYHFCWNCQREWKGAVQNAVQCGNNDCGKKVILPDLLVKCKPEFKQEKIKNEGDDIYPTKDKSLQRKRLALLINNVEFEYLSNRTGADKDELSMEKLLNALGFTVVTLRDLTAQGMSAAMRDFAKREEHVQSDSCFVVFMSHGNGSGIVGTSYINNSNGEEDIFFTDEIFNCLNTPNCAGLRDKPKIILIQACRGGNDGSIIVQDSVPANNRKKEHREKDFCCLRSSTPDTVSYRHEKKGSDFIQDIAEIFNHHAHHDHIEELFRKVLKKFKEKHPDQMPCKERTTLSKKFYLFPGL